MPLNLPVFFGELLVGAILIDKGVAAVRTSLGGGTAAAASGSSPAAAATTGSTATGTVTASSLSGLAKAKGWGAAQISSWLAVISMESGGNPTAQNPHSNAYGIAQFINGPGEYANYGGDVNTIQGQLTAMANYISQRYGTPDQALAHEHAYGWY